MFELVSPGAHLGSLDVDGWHIPILINIRLNVKSTTIRTRASFDYCLLCGPPISKTCANSFFDRSFVFAAPTLWNALDLDNQL